MCGESGGCMWRVKEAEETKDETHEALRGATGSGNVTVGNGATAGIFNVNSIGTTIASYNTDIGNFGNTAVLVNLGFNGSGGPVGTVNIGRGATAVTIGNTAAGFRSAGPITLGTAPTGSTGIASGSAAPYLGIFYSPVISTTLVATNTAQTSIAIGTPGIYLFTFSIQLAYSTIPTTFYVTLSGANIVNNTAYGYSIINTGNLSSQGSLVISCTASTYNLLVNYSAGTGMSVNNQSFFQSVRIG